MGRAYGFRPSGKLHSQIAPRKRAVIIAIVAAQIVDHVLEFFCKYIEKN